MTKKSTKKRNAKRKQLEKTASYACDECWDTINVTAENMPKYLTG